MIPPTPAIESGNDKYDFKVNGAKADNAKSVENLFLFNRAADAGKGSEWLVVPKLHDSRRLSIPVVLIPGNRRNADFDSNDNVYLENLYKAASVSSLGNFGSIAAEPMPIIKNKDGKWLVNIFIYL